MISLTDALHDPARLSALASSGLLDSAPEDAFDRLTRLAAAVLDAPVALVSLVDAERQYFKSAHGLPEPLASVRETPLDQSLCRYAVCQGEPLLIEDGAEHPLVCDNPAIRDLGVRAYAGIPLRDADGHVLGTLCVVDTRPRSWSERDVRLLADLASGAMTEIALRRTQEERDRLVEALRRERERLGDLFQQAPAFIATSRGPDHVIELANRAFYQLVGFRDIVGKPVVEAIPESAEQGFKALLDEVYRTGKSYAATGTRVYYHRVPGNEPVERIVDFVYQPVLEADGSCSGVFCHGVDVTEQARAAALVREAERHFRAVFEGAAIGIVLMEADGRPRRANPAMLQMLGFTHDELCAMSFMDFTHPEDRAQGSAQVRELFAGERARIESTKRYVRRDGSTVWARLTATLLQDATGGPACALAMVEDTTAARDAERARRESEERYRQLVERSPDGIVIHRDGVVLFANAVTARMAGAPSPEAMVGRRVMDFVHASSRAVACERLDAVTGGVEAPPMEQRWKSPDGEATIDVEVTSMPFTFDGRPAVQTVFRDITQRRHLEEQLRQAQKMEAIGRLAGGVAHDFNNLLTVIKGSTEFLIDALEPRDPRYGDAEEVLKATRRAMELTRQLLAFSRKQLLNPRPLDPNEVVANVRPMLARMIGEDVAVETELHAAPGTIMADAGQLEQVLVNLVVNARDAMPEGGRIVISTAPVDVDARTAAAHRAASDRPVVLPGRYVLLSVRDTGTGMSPEVRARAFEPFFTTKPAGKGTGLGLATVYGIVRQSGGHVWVESSPGEGAVFHIYLPRISSAAAEAIPATAEEPPPRGSETVLVVEDEPALREITRRSLAKQGYRVLTAGDGREALALATGHAGPIHLVLTDVVMPGMSGRGLVERLRAVRPSTAVLYMSGYTDDDVVRRGVVTSETAFLQKPFSPVTLLQAVRAALDEHAPA